VRAARAASVRAEFGGAGLRVKFMTRQRLPVALDSRARAL
jgi:hypothetical protein